MVRLLTKFQTRLNGAITAAATSIVVDSVTSIPSVPFLAIIGGGTTDEEVVDVTAVATGTKTLTVTRAQRSTTAVAHGDHQLLHHSEVVRADLEADIVDGTKLADDAVESEHYAATSIDKEHLASTIYTIEHIIIAVNSGKFDNQTIKVSRVWSACTVVRVVYFTDGVLDTDKGIDILDGGSDGSGTTVIDSCDDNLNGLDSNDLTPYALDANDYILIKFDDINNDVDITIDIQLKVPITTAT